MKIVVVPSLISTQRNSHLDFEKGSDRSRFQGFG